MSQWDKKNKKIKNLDGNFNPDKSDQSTSIPAPTTNGYAPGSNMASFDTYTIQSKEKIYENNENVFVNMWYYHSFMVLNMKCILMFKYHLLSERMQAISNWLDLPHVMIFPVLRKMNIWSLQRPPINQESQKHHTLDAPWILKSSVRIA